MDDDIVNRLRDLDAQPVWWFQISWNDIVEAADEIERLRAELAEFQRQYLMLKVDRDRWKKICDYWYKASCSHNWRQDQAARRKYEQAVRGD